MSTRPKKHLGRPVDLAKREAILNAATQAFYHHGYAGAAIEQIAIAANVSKVTVYNHFGDKRALLGACVERECNRMRQHFSIPPPDDETLRERLLAIGEDMIAFLSRPEIVQFERRIAAEVEQDPEIGLAYLDAGPRRMRGAFIAYLADLVDKGVLAMQDPSLAAEQFASMCKGFAHVELRFGAVPDPAVTRRRIEGAVDTFLAAYLRKD